MSVRQCHLVDEDVTARSRIDGDTQMGNHASQEPTMPSRATRRRALQLGWT